MLGLIRFECVFFLLVTFRRANYQEGQPFGKICTEKNEVAHFGRANLTFCRQIETLTSPEQILTHVSCVNFN